jgi:CRP-like cAMP-binding protein
VELQPGNIDARLRIGDALLATGDVQRAAVVYTALARHAALAGYPLRALIAIKLLHALEPKLGVLISDIARMYARDSERLGRSVRRALPSLSQVLPNDFTPEVRLPSGANLPEYAQRIASDYTTSELVYPERLMPVPLLSLFPMRDFETLLSVLRVVRTRPDMVILREGDPGTSFFVLARGSVNVRAKRDGSDTQLAQLQEGSIFGEMALLSAAPRTASVLSHDDCDLLEFDCAQLSHATSTLRSLSQTLDSFARERLIHNVFATSALFKPLDGKQRVDLMRRFVSLEANHGDTLIREGDPGQGVYVVLRGEVAVLRNEDGAPRPFGSVRGDFTAHERAGHGDRARGQTGHEPALLEQGLLRAPARRSARAASLLRAVERGSADGSADQSQRDRCLRRQRARDG